MTSHSVSGRFELVEVVLNYPNNRKVAKYVVVLNGVNCKWWLSSTVKSKDEALKHFWRLIGES